MDSREAAAAFDAIKPVEPSVSTQQDAAAPAPIKHKRKRINVKTGQWEEIEVELPPGTDTRNPVVDLDRLEPPTEADVAAGRASAEVAAEMRRAKELREAAEAAAAKAAPSARGEALPSARGEQTATIEVEDEPDAEDPEDEDEEPEQEQAAAPAAPAAPKQLAAAPAPVQPAVQALPVAPAASTGAPHADDEKLIAAMKQWCVTNGVNSALMVSPLRGYLGYLREHKIPLATAPAGTATEFLLSRYEKPASRNVVGLNLLRGLTVLRELGLTVSQQTRVNEKLPYQPRQKKAVRLPQQMSPEVAMAEQQTQQIEVGGSAASQQTVTVQQAPAAVAAPVQQAAPAQPAQVIQLPPPPPPAPKAVKPGTPVAPGTPIATVHGQVVTAAAPLPTVAPQARGAARRLNVGVGADGLPVGGKFKFSRKTTGAEPGFTPGTLIAFGAPVPASTVSTFPSVDEWIQLNLLPSLKHLAGQDVTIVVERLDDRGSPMRPPEEFYYNVPGQPGMMPGMPQPQWGAQPWGYPGMPQQPGWVGAQQPQQPSANERLLEFLLKQNDDLQKQARELAYPKDGRPDATAMMMAMQMQQQSAEIARKVEETRAQIAAERNKPQPRFGGGFGGLSGLTQQQGGEFGQPGPRFPMMPPMIADDSRDAMADLAKTVIEKTFDKPAAPAPVAAPDPLSHPLVAQMLTSMMAPKQQGPDPVLMEMLRESRERAAKLEERLERVTERLTSPDKTSEMDKAMGMIDKLMVLREKVEPPQSTPGLTDVLMNLVNQLPEIMPSLASMAVKPPMLTGGQQAALPAHQPSGGGGGGAQQQQQQTAPQAPQLPESAKAALYALRDSAGLPLTTPIEVQKADQATVNALFAIIKSLLPLKEWQPVAEAFGAEFAAANSRPEVEAGVKKALISVGARGLANNAAVVTRATDALHRNYTQLYAMLNKGAAPKTMPDAALTAVPSGGGGGGVGGGGGTQQAQPTQPQTVKVDGRPKPAPVPERRGPPPELINDGDAVVMTARSTVGNYAPKAEPEVEKGGAAAEPAPEKPAVPVADPTLVTV